jgi:hypothetical protein
LSASLERVDLKSGRCLKDEVLFQESIAIPFETGYIENEMIKDYGQNAIFQYSTLEA